MTTARLDAAVRESRAVLAVADGVLVLWMRDDDGDETADADEVRRLEHDADAATLTSYRSTVFTEAEEDAGMRCRVPQGPDAPGCSTGPMPPPTG